MQMHQLTLNENDFQNFASKILYLLLAYALGFVCTCADEFSIHKTIRLFISA